MAASQRSTLNLGLPATPETVDQKLFYELVRVYNAINILAQGLDNYTSDGTVTTTLTTQIVEFKNYIESVIDVSADVSELNKSFKSYVAGYAVPWATPGTIGSTTPNTGKFTSLQSATSVIDNSIAAGQPLIIKCATGATGIKIQGRTLDSFGYLEWYNAAGTVLSGAIYGFPGRITMTGPTGTDIVSITDAGAKVHNAFACNGKAVQTAFALPAAATDLATVITLANALRTALINNGIGV